MVTGLKIAFICATPRHPLGPQVAMAKADGAEQIIVLSRKGPRVSGVEYRSLRDALRLLRHTTDLRVPYLYAFGFQKRAKTGSRRDMFDNTIDEIDVREAKFTELSSGLWSGDPAQRRKMLRDARAAVTSGGRALSGAENGVKNKRGRKAFDPSEELKREAKAVWLNLRDYPTWDDAAKALPEGFTVWYCHRVWKARTKRVKS